MVDDAPVQVPTPEPTPPEPAQEVPAAVEMPVPAPTEATAPETQTAQVPVNEPLPPEHEPFDSAQDKPIAPTPAPEPTTSASAPTTASSPQAAPAVAHGGRDLLVKARATIQDRKHKKLEKILEALTVKGKITNDEVEKLLHVSDATATRYLSALEKEGKIQQVGKTGKAVEYMRI